VHMAKMLELQSIVHQPLHTEVIGTKLTSSTAWNSLPDPVLNPNFIEAVVRQKRFLFTWYQRIEQIMGFYNMRQ